MSSEQEIGNVLLYVNLSIGPMKIRNLCKIRRNLHLPLKNQSKRTVCAKLQLRECIGQKKWILANQDIPSKIIYHPKENAVWVCARFQVAGHHLIDIITRRRR